MTSILYSPFIYSSQSFLRLSKAARDFAVGPAHISAIPRIWFPALDSWLLLSFALPPLVFEPGRDARRLGGSHPFPNVLLFNKVPQFYVFSLEFLAHRRDAGF